MRVQEKSVHSVNKHQHKVCFVPDPCQALPYNGLSMNTCGPPGTYTLGAHRGRAPALTSTCFQTSSLHVRSRERAVGMAWDTSSGRGGGLGSLHGVHTYLALVRPAVAETCSSPILLVSHPCRKSTPAQGLGESPLPAPAFNPGPVPSLRYSDLSAKVNRTCISDLPVAWVPSLTIDS